MERYGHLLETMKKDSVSVTIKSVVTVRMISFMSQLFLIMMLLQMKRHESIAVMLIMISLILQFGCTLAIRPYESTVIAMHECFNLVTQLYLSYLMLLFTDFSPCEI
jgi:hypothetical protein